MCTSASVTAAGSPTDTLASPFESAVTAGSAVSFITIVTVAPGGALRTRTVCAEATPALTLTANAIARVVSGRIRIVLGIVGGRTARTIIIQARAGCHSASGVLYRGSVSVSGVVLDRALR